MGNNDWRVEYYETEEGISVVEGEIESFGPRIFARVLRTVDLLEEFGLELGTEYVSHVRGKIWELKVTRYRVLYFAFTGRRFVLLRAFIKKTKKTPQKEILIAKNRMDDFISRIAILSIERGKGGMKM